MLAHELADSRFRNAEVIHGLGLIGNLSGRWRTQRDKGLGAGSTATDRIHTLSMVAKTVRMLLRFLKKSMLKLQRTELELFFVKKLKRLSR